VRGHLIAYGIRQSYTFWCFHGEMRASNLIIEDDDESDAVAVDMDAGVEDIDGTTNVDDEPMHVCDDEYIEDIVNDMYSNVGVHTKAFYRLLDDSKLPLYSGFSNL
ncbi:hypothetical protein, partial [Serratia marcescens]|uniref:hypothetical protein n=1 Tax=Serratia marcescens TaxID=615 RepID=UPI0028129A7E